MTITSEQIIAIALGLIGCISFLFRLLIKSMESAHQQTVSAMNEVIKTKDEAIGWYRDELRQALRTNERATSAAEKATTVAQKVVDG